MLAIFCLRLACGLIGALALFSSRDVNPRFFRAQYRIALMLATVGAWRLWDDADPTLKLVCVASIVMTLAGSVAWSLDNAPASRAIGVLTLLLLVCALGMTGHELQSSTSKLAALAAEYPSSAYLGISMTAMLMGHSYLNAPSMSVSPLMNLLRGVLVTGMFRMAVAAAALIAWTHTHAIVNLNDDVALWLLPRWTLGFAAPLILVWMAGQAARIRSTQSATGILYAAVVFVCLGELLGVILQEQTGYSL